MEEPPNIMQTYKALDRYTWAKDKVLRTPNIRNSLLNEKGIQKVKERQLANDVTSAPLSSLNSQFNSQKKLHHNGFNKEISPYKRDNVSLSVL